MADTKYRPKPMTKGQFEALKNVLVYFTAELMNEKNHWDDTGQPKDHIYNEWQRLLDYIAQCQVKENTDD